MGSRYVMKVSEMNELANGQYRVLNDLANVATTRCKEAYEQNIGDALREALARMDALDDLKRLQQMEEEVKALRNRIAENLEFTGYYRNNLSLSYIMDMGSQYQPYASLPDQLNEEVMQVMSERGIKIARYSPPSPSDMVKRFKQCATLAEVKQVMEGYQREALTQLAPVLGTTTQEGA